MLQRCDTTHQLDPILSISELHFELLDLLDLFVGLSLIYYICRESSVSREKSVSTMAAFESSPFFSLLLAV